MIIREQTHLMLRIHALSINTALRGLILSPWMNPFYGHITGRSDCHNDSRKLLHITPLYRLSDTGSWKYEKDVSLSIPLRAESDCSIKLFTV